MSEPSPPQPSPNFTETPWWRRIEAGTHTAEDLQCLRAALESTHGRGFPWSKYNIRINEVNDIHINKSAYLELGPQALDAIAAAIHHRTHPTLPPPNFQPYLQSIVNTYQHWQERYTLTDVVGRSRTAATAEAAKTLTEMPFDFGLMVQTVAQRKEEPDHPTASKDQEPQEKIECLPVLEGVLASGSGVGH